MRGLLRQALKRACCLLGVSAVAFAVPLFVCIQVICAGTKVNICAELDAMLSAP
jgi:hypothetical protein